MSFSASSADERVLDVLFTEDTISVNLRDHLSTEGLLRGAPAPKTSAPAK
ncbi:MAG: hypothetical protein LAO23_05920 [Acidobacteriia bacterium]|nr:hypothetical protein [Terriglobia bacterium]